MATFSLFPGLPEKIKQLIVNQTDFQTRSNLQFCSKECNLLVENGEWKGFEKVEIVIASVYKNKEAVEENGETINTILKLVIYEDGQIFEFSFFRNVFSRSYNPLEGPICDRILEEEVISMSYQLINFIIQQNILKTKELIIDVQSANPSNEWNMPIFEIQSSDITILISRSECLDKLSDIITPNCDMTIKSHQNIENIGEYSIIRNADKLKITIDCDISNQQLLSITAKCIQLESTDIDYHGINQFIRKWINKETRDDFEYFTLKMDKKNGRLEQFLENVSFEKVQIPPCHSTKKSSNDQVKYHDIPVYCCSDIALITISPFRRAVFSVKVIKNDMIADFRVI